MVVMRRAIGLGLLLGLFALGTWSGAGSVAAASDKPYAVKITHAENQLGADKQFTVEIDNKAKHTMGSANITPAAGITATSATLPANTPGTATVTGGVVELRNLNLIGGSKRTVTITADQGSCSDDFLAWLVAAKQANDFKGTGNDFTLVNTPGTTVDCEVEQVCAEKAPDLDQITEEDYFKIQEDCIATLTYKGRNDIEWNPTFLGVSYTLTFEVMAVPVLDDNDGSLSISIDPKDGIDCASVVDPLNLLERAGVSGRSTYGGGVISNRKKIITWTIDYALPADNKATPLENETQIFQKRPPLAGLCFKAPYPFFTTHPNVGSYPDAQLQFTGVLPACNGIRNVRACYFDAAVLNKPDRATTNDGEDEDVDRIRSELPAGPPDPYTRG